MDELSKTTERWGVGGEERARRLVGAVLDVPISAIQVVVPRQITISAYRRASGEWRARGRAAE